VRRNHGREQTPPRSNPNFGGDKAKSGLRATLFYMGDLEAASVGNPGQKIAEKCQLCEKGCWLIGRVGPITRSHNEGGAPLAPRSSPLCYPREPRKRHSLRLKPSVESRWFRVMRDLIF